jgi:septal ring factor EnvC (AmiA/AmiB activator)
MSDEDEPKEEPKPKEVEKVVHVGMTEEQVDSKMRTLRDELSELHAGDKKEREELKAELAELREYKEQQEKNLAEKDKVKDSESTIVLPPTDIPPQQPNVGTAPTSKEKRRMAWW